MIEVGRMTVGYRIRHHRQGMMSSEHSPKSMIPCWRTTDEDTYGPDPLRVAMISGKIPLIMPRVRSSWPTIIEPKFSMNSSRMVRAGPRRATLWIDPESSNALAEHDGIGWRR